MTLSGNEIREKFLNYFQSKEHTVVKSAPLIPQNDPTLYFTNAGMVPFKNVFTGEEKKDYSRATSSQKCIRVSGKHNDLENVGRTERHHTFFEMLGNFSFGDYFKSEAIAFAWEFLTRDMKLPKNKLWVTVFETDDEAAEIWYKEQEVPKERIIRMGEKDNFWSMGETGPCGPCSEIHIEKDYLNGINESTLKEFDEDKVMEIWNLVFMQYDRDAHGKLNSLPKPSIDTGMGLERLTAVLQRVPTNYDTDLFMPLIRQIENMTGKKYGSDKETTVSIRVLADHIRATVFLISDGVLPSNEGRGYVLRRIMRRAIRHGKLLDQTQAFFYKLADTLISEMESAYPELRTNQSTIEKVIKAEEERFFETLDKGLKILDEEIQKLKTENESHNTLPGEVAFKLYDTYGFPLDLTELIAEEHGLKVDQKGFDECMTEQKERARAHWKGSGEDKVNQVYLEIANNHETKFLGYDTLEAPAKIVALLQNGDLVNEVQDGKCEIIFDQTPFYGEGGGQVGDKGHLSQDGIEAHITDTIKPVAGIFVHKVKIKKGSLKTGDTVQLKVDREMRRPTMRNHSATHLLHAALRKILGDHVRQAGSLVNEEILRFDFTHFEAIPTQTLRDIEDEVNRAILEDYPICKEEMAYDEAIAKGALAFFGDKYGDKVRVVSMGRYSVELCGGTHLNHTSEIGFFKILSEGSIAAGVRRLEATTGWAAMKKAQEEAHVVQKLCADLKVSPHEIPERLQKFKDQIKALETEQTKLKQQLLRGASTDLLADKMEVNDIVVVPYLAPVDNAKDLQDVAQAILDKIQSGVAVVYAEIKGKVSLLVMVSKDLTAKVQANKILQPLAEVIGGRGGGKPDRAQAGGTEVSKMGEIPGKLKEILD